MSLETTLRYETNVRKGSLIQTLNRQQKRIQTAELMANRENTVRLEQQINLKSDWDESVSRNEACRMKYNNKISKTELKLVNTTVNAVRKAALKNLLDKEQAMYAKELQELGKTFYVQRA
ncbi:cilia- and flagella-associated protein 141-like [Lineus longissimus]|uniref:cilia- and flagella-associated protein 141-like n=1 Tax=Lineus longissimus TaxID=88925 RepID=UPI002B4F33D4